MYVESIARYPVKGLQPDWLSSVVVEEARGLPLDRRFAFWKASSEASLKPQGWLAKQHLLCVMTSPMLARVAMAFDHNNTSLNLYLDGEYQGVFQLEQKESMADLEVWVANFLSLSTPCVWLDSAGWADESTSACEKSDSRGAEHYADNNSPYISLINTATLQEMKETFAHDMEHARFRGNLYFGDGFPWQEREWAGKTLQIGEVTCEVIEEISRCRATCVHPVSGVLDKPVPKKLLQHYGHDYCGIFAIIRKGGQLQKGQTVRVI